MEKIINLLSTNVADFYNLKTKGKIIKGYDADFAMVNLWDSQKINAENMHSKGKYTPFEGITFEAVLDKTVLKCHKIINNNSTVQIEKIGKFIRV